MAAPTSGSRAATYARVSTADPSPDLQHDGLRAFADRAGLFVVVATSHRTKRADRTGTP